VLFQGFNIQSIISTKVTSTPDGVKENEDNTCPTTSVNIELEYNMIKEDVIRMLQIFSLDELNILHKIILLSDLNGKRNKDLNKAIECLKKIDETGLSVAKSRNNDRSCDIYLNTLTTYSEIVSNEALYYSVSKMVRILEKISDLDKDTYKAAQYLFDIVKHIEEMISIVNSGVHQKSIHMGIEPKNYDLDKIFKKPEMNSFGSTLLNKLDQLLEKDNKHLKCDIPNSPYPAPINPPRCVPQKQCMEQPVGIMFGGTPGSVVNYTGVGSMLPKFAYSELYDPQYYT